MKQFLTNPPPPYLSLKGWAEFTSQTVAAVTSQADKGFLETFKLNEDGERATRYVNVVAEYERMSKMAESLN